MAALDDGADSPTRKREPSMEALPKIEHASGFERHILVTPRAFYEPRLFGPPSASRVECALSRSANVASQVNHGARPCSHVICAAARAACILDANPQGSGPNVQILRVQKA